MVNTTKYRIPPLLIDGNCFYADDQGRILDANDKVKPQHFSEADRNHRGGSMYPYIRFGKYTKKAHNLICAARWGIPRKGQVCHHLNGNKFDNRPDNLIWLSKSRHYHYDARLKALKALVKNVSIYSRRDFIRFARMSEPSFQSMLAGFHRDPRTTDEIMQSDMSHHMEI